MIKKTIMMRHLSVMSFSGLACSNDACSSHISVIVIQYIDPPQDLSGLFLIAYDTADLVLYNDFSILSFSSVFQMKSFTSWDCPLTVSVSDL